LGIQRELEKKWKTPYFNQKLTSIKFNEVGLRGVKNSTINFNYLITAIADGDLTEKELRTWSKKHILKSYQGELFDEEIFQQKSRELFCKFAGDNAPEKFMLEKLKEKEAYARFVDDSDEFVSFLANEISLSDHHGLFRVIGEKIGLGEEISRMRIVDGVVRFYLDEFEEVKKIIEKEIK